MRCHCCQVFLATRFFAGASLCYVCFLKIDKRLLDEKQREARAEVEIEKLESWYQLPDAEVKR